jgi:hypothetical protein
MKQRWQKWKLDESDEKWNKLKKPYKKLYENSGRCEWKPVWL